ncbi:MAG: helix-turn-helix domain-containing protein [bacterium]
MSEVSGLDLKAAVRKTERKFILKALRITNGNQKYAARLLGIKRTTLIEKMIRLDLVKRKGRNNQETKEIKRLQATNTEKPKGEFKDAVRSFERDLIVEALQRSDWVKSRAARLLNINRTTLIEKIKKLNISQ